MNANSITIKLKSNSGLQELYLSPYHTVTGGKPSEEAEDLKGAQLQSPSPLRKGPKPIFLLPNGMTMIVGAKIDDYSFAEREQPADLNG